MQLNVQNMTCGGCAKAVKSAILGIDAAAVIKVDPTTRTVVVETTQSPVAIHKALAEAGYPATAK